MVFVDDGGTNPSAMGGWTVYSNQWQWWDPPPVRHGDGTMFSFADGHSEYHKWEDSRTIDFGKRMPSSGESRKCSRTMKTCMGVLCHVGSRCGAADAP